MKDDAPKLPELLMPPWEYGGSGAPANDVWVWAQGGNPTMDNPGGEDTRVFHAPPEIAAFTVAKVNQAAELERKAGRVAELEKQLVAMDKMLLDANPEIARLRKLIKDGCYAGEDYRDCPWCTFIDEPLAPGRLHKPSCPAFTLDGVVR